MTREQPWPTGPAREERGPDLVVPPPAADKPTHYRVVCHSLYTRDLDTLDRKVRELRDRGFTKANKSWLVRIALARLDVATLTDGEIGAIP